MPLSGSHMQLKFRKLSNLLNVSTNLRVVTRAKTASPTHFLCARYPHPKSLPSGKGLTIALAGSKSGISHLRNLKYKNTFFPLTITKKPRNAISSTARLRRYINVNQLKFRNCKTLVNQSFLSESTGLEVAASQLRSVTISIVIASTITRDNANTHQWIGV